MPDIVRQVLADHVLVGAIAFAVFINLGALGLKWERKRRSVTASVDAEGAH